MKKLCAWILSLLMIASVFSACGKTGGDTDEPMSNDDTTVSKETEELVVVRLGGLKGPTSMGMVKLLDDAEQHKTLNEYEYAMASSADELTPRLLSGDLDILAVPANLGSVLYNNADGAVQVAAINTLGVLYIVEKGGDTVQSMADLKETTIYATGKGTTPEYALDYLLEQSGLDPASDVTIEWKNEPTEVAAQMATVDHAIAMMPQPFVTVAQQQIEGLRIAVDMTAAWDSIDNGSQLITATLIVRRAFAEEHPEALKTFLAEYEASNEYVNSHAEEAAVLVEKYGIVKAPIAEKAIPYCRMVCITGEEMKEALSGYLAVLMEREPKAVGGALPKDDYYLIYE